MTTRPYRPRRQRYDGGSAPRTLCHLTYCRANAHYQGVHNLRFYCPNHAADIAAIVPLRDIDGLTEALRTHDDISMDGTPTPRKVPA